MSPNALEYDMFALEIQSQLRTGPGTAYGALLLSLLYPSSLPRLKHTSFSIGLIGTGSWQLVRPNLWCISMNVRFVLIV